MVVEAQRVGVVDVAAEVDVHVDEAGKDGGVAEVEDLLLRVRGGKRLAGGDLRDLPGFIDPYGVAAQDGLAVAR